MNCSALDHETDVDIRARYYVCPVYASESAIARKTGCQGPSHHQQTTAPQNNPQAQVTVKKRIEPNVQSQNTPSAQKSKLPAQDEHDYTLLGMVINGVLTLITLGIAVASIIQALAAKESANTAKASADFAEKALRLSERADILLDKAGLSTGIDAYPHSRVLLEFKNFGRTRARNVIFDVSLTVPDMPDAKPQPLSPLTIAAGDSKTVSFESFVECFTQAGFNGVFNGTVPLRFFGTVAYEDVFSVSHKSHCSGVFDHHTRHFRMEKNEGD